MLEIAVYYQFVNLVPINYPVHHRLNMVPLQLWQKKSMEVHLLLKAQMQVRNNSCILIPEVYAM
ncbi:hypothetical protein IX51_07625 [uncultured archaeon]|nr:hypothetical protein IX51_07625 [uncultured archaeon]